MHFRSNDPVKIHEIIPHLICAFLAVIGYYVIIILLSLPALWTYYLHIAMKVIVALSILLSARKTITGPLIALGFGVFLLLGKLYDTFSLLPTTDAWQLVIVALLGVFVKALHPK